MIPSASRANPLRPCQNSCEPKPLLTSYSFDMCDPSRDGVAEVLRCDSSGLVFCLEEPEAALSDCANQAAVPLHPSQTVFASL